MQRAGDADEQFPSDLVAGALDNDHGAVVEITDALFRFLTRLDNFHLHRLTGQSHDLERIGQIVDVHHIHLAHPRDLAEIVVRRGQPPVEGLRKHHQLLIDAFDFLDLGEHTVIDLYIDHRIRLHLVQDVESPPAAVALELVGRIRYQLELVEHEAGDNERRIEQFALAQIHNASVNDGRRVQNQRPGPLGLLGKFHVGNHEAHVVLGPHNNTNGKIANTYSQQPFDGINRFRD